MSIRLFVHSALGQGPLLLDREQSHYLTNVMRLQVGSVVNLFNGRDGEWSGPVQVLHKNGVQIALERCERPQQAEPEVWLAAAPIKKDCMDWLVEKSVELGMTALLPTITRRTQNSRINGERLLAQMTEAVEQCERLSLPTLGPVMDLRERLDSWPTDRPLYFLEERSAAQPMARHLTAGIPGPVGVLAGPEGGFTSDEKQLIRRYPFAIPVSLGERILRAETAAIAALSIIQAMRDAHPGPKAD